MSKSDRQLGLNSILSRAEHIYKLAKKLDIPELENKLPEYTRVIEKYFNDLDKKSLTNVELDKLKQLISTHEKIVNLIHQQRNKVSKNIKKLHSGKMMQRAYPQTAY